MISPTVENPIPAKEVSIAKKTENIGYFGRFLQNITAPVDPKANQLEEKNIKPINGRWSGLLYELAQFLLIDKAGMTGVAENESLFINMSTIVKQVLLAIGTVNLDANQPAELDDPEFIKHLIANLLNIFKKTQDLKHFDLDAAPNSEEGKSLRNELNQIFNELMVNAGLDQEHVKDKPGLVQHLLYPSILVKFGLGILSYAKGLPALNRGSFENMFAEGIIGILRLQKKIEAKSQDGILKQNEGLLELIDSFVKTKISKKIRNGDLPFTYEFLKSKKNSTFLSSMINRVLAEQGQNGPDGLVINKAWESIENQLKMAIQAISAVLLTTKQGQSPAERRNVLIVGILDRLDEHIEGLNKRVLNIKRMQRFELEQTLANIRGAYGERAKELLNRKEIKWDDEVAAFINEVWREKIPNIEPLTHQELLTRLKNWKSEKKNNPLWRVAFSDRAQILLGREKLDWESQVCRFLKEIEYVQAIQSILKYELNPKKFAEFIPKLFKAEDLFQGLYEFIGESALELHEQQQLLDKLGNEALSFINHSSIAKLPKFMEEVMGGLVAALEEKGEKNEIDLGYGKFPNDIFCSFLKAPEEVVLVAPEDSEEDLFDDIEDAGLVYGHGKNLAKKEILALAKNILMIVIKHAIECNTNDQCPQEEAFSNLVNHFVKNALDGLKNISESCNAMKDKPTQEKIEDVRGLIAKLGIKKFVVKNTDEELMVKYRKLLIQSLSRDLISFLMTEELFNSLLPPMFRKAGLWEWVVDGMVAPYLEGISKKLESFRVAELQKDSIEAQQLKLTGDCQQLRSLIKPLTTKACEVVSDVKFVKLFTTDEKKSKLNKVNFEILDELFGKALQQGGQITQLIELAFPKIIESILAFHLNSQEGKSSQERATDLLWDILKITHHCYHKIDAIRGQDSTLESLKKEFKANDDLSKKRLNGNIEAYCKEKKLMTNPASILEDKKFYIWLKVRQEIDVDLKKLMDLVIPENLWNVYVPKEFNQLITKNRIKELILSFLNEGYEHSVNMKKMVSEGKIHLQNEEVNEEDDAKTALQRFIEKKVTTGLKDATKMNANDEDSIRWVRGVVKHLLDKENESESKPLTKIAINGVYAIFGKLLSGGLPRKVPDLLKDVEGIDNDLILLGKIAKLIPEIQRDYDRLNELKAAQKCSELPQITIENIKSYLSLGRGSLKEYEHIEKLPEKFEKKDDIIVFRVSINTKTNVPREVFVDATRFIYWQLGHQGLNELISDDDWKELVPSLMRPILTKEVLAEFAVPYIHAACQIQKPLEKKVEAGKEVIDEISNEDPEGNLKKFIQEEIIGKIHIFLNAISNQPAKFDNTLPDVLDKLLKDLLKTQCKNILDVRNALVEKGCYLLFNELLNAGERGKSNASATLRAAAKLISKLNEIILVYNQPGKNPAVIVQKLLDELVPEATRKEIFTGKFNDIISEKVIVDQLEKKAAELFSKIEMLNLKKMEALAEIKQLDEQARLADGRGGGLEEIVKSLCRSIDETIDAYGLKNNKILDNQPLLINELVKCAFRFPAVSGVIKDSSKAMVILCLARIFKAKEGQPPEERLLEVLSSLIKSYNAADPKAAATAWLQEFFPEDLRKEIIPPFLHDTLSHAFLAEMLFAEYIPEVAAVVQSLNAAPKDDEKNNISHLQGTIKNIIAHHKDPEYSKNGVTGLGGFVKPLETILAMAATGNLKEEKKFEVVGQTVEKFIDSTVAYALTMPQVKNLLNNQFLTEALIDALPMFGAVDKEKALPNYPKIQDDLLMDLSIEGLSKMGVAVRIIPGEKDEALKRRLNNKHFEEQCGKLASEIPFSNGAADLPLPKIVQSAVFTQIQEIAAGQVGRIVNRNQRILAAIEFFGVNSACQKDYNAMKDQLKLKGNLDGKEKMAERLFKNGLLAFMMQKIEQNVAKGWPRPFRWLAVQFIKSIVSMALRLAVNQQVWKFVSDAKNDSKFRLFVWKFLSFAKTYEPKVKKKDELRTKLKDEFSQSFKNAGLLNGIRPTVASTAAAFLQDQNFVSLIS